MLRLTFMSTNQSTMGVTIGSTMAHGAPRIDLNERYGPRAQEFASRDRNLGMMILRYDVLWL